MSLTPEDIQMIDENLHLLAPSDKEMVLKALDALERKEETKKRQTSLIEFAKAMMPEYKVGVHHKKLAAYLEDMAYGRKSRVTINIAPRFGKSQLTSVFFPAWFIGNFPHKKIMMVSHTAELAVDFGRKVRNLISDSTYQTIFPGVELSKDSKSAGRWSTNFDGEYFAVGVGGALAGRGADLLVIDDPHNEQDVLNGNYEIFDRAYEWYAYGARTRLSPTGGVALVMCMTGDTPVLMADGHEKPLEQVRPGDIVATYDNGSVATSKVMNWQCSGADKIYKIRTTCGKIVRANERHPFLVNRGGKQSWVRLKNLKPGDTLVSLTAATGPDEQKQNQVSVDGANLGLHTTENTQTLRTMSWGTTGNGEGLSARNEGVLNKHTLKGYAKPTTTRITTLRSLQRPQKINELGVLSIVTELQSKTTSVCSQSKMAGAQSVMNPREITFGHTGEENFVSTTATTQIKSEPSYATTVTLLSGTQKRQKPQKLSLSTYEPTQVEIFEIAPDGQELVYDVQIEHTENFIANGIVSHNTRWAENDLTGQLVRDMVKNPGTDQWDVVEFPALFENEDADMDAPLTDKYRSLWPEQWPVEALLATKASMPTFQWSAQYMQDPTNRESSIIKKEWWREWTKLDPPACEFIIMTLDAAAEKNNRADYTGLTTWGVFMHEDEVSGRPTANIIALNSIKKRVEFPDLKRLASREYSYWEPDAFVVEKKSSGTPLYQELRAAGVPVDEFTPHRGTGDKTARLNSVSDIFSSGMVWFPAGRRWAEELRDEVCGFPAAPNDDLTDCTIMALMRFRTGGFISLPSDTWDDDEDFQPVRAAYY